MNGADYFRPHNHPDGVKQLEKDGYFVLPQFMDQSFLQELQLQTNRIFEREGDRAGEEFKTEAGSMRLANLVNKGNCYRRLIINEIILEWVTIVLGQSFKLSSLNARKALPHNGVSQPLHCDMGAVPDPTGYWVCNTIWLLDPFTLENGPTRIVPGSHHSNKLPQVALKDPSAPHKDEIFVQAPIGSVVIMNAHLWHGGTTNNTSTSRTALHGFYVRSDKPQQQFQKKLLDPNLQRNLSPMERKILAIDDKENDRLSCAPSQTSGFMK